MPTSANADLRFDAIILSPPPGWDAWGQLRVTAINHRPIPADLTRICRRFQFGGKIVSMLEVGYYDEAAGVETWPPEPTGGEHRCSDIREYRVPAALGTTPGLVTFDVLILPGRTIGKLGYKVHYRWIDAPGDERVGLAQP